MKPIYKIINKKEENQEAVGGFAIDSFPSIPKKKKRHIILY